MHPDPRRPRPSSSTSSSAMRQTSNSAVIAVLVAAVACGGLLAVIKGDDGGGRSVAAASETTPTDALPTETVPADTNPAAVDPATGAAATDAAAGTGSSVAAVETSDDDLLGDLDTTSTTGCTLTVQSTRLGDANSSVACLQQALAAEGFYSGAATGTFDQATDSAVRALQTERNLYVDGVVGRESAISLGIWPDEASLVVHTPPPTPGSVDLLGYRLSTVAVSGPDAPPLPENSGSGKRIVYDRAGQRVWAINADNVVVRSYLVAGSKYANETPGVHKVYSKSEMSTAWNGQAWLPLMVRYLKTTRGAIGFHAIPIHVNDNSPYMTDAEMGQRLSGGCQRQTDLDAKFMWDFADIGTTVVVI